MHKNGSLSQEFGTSRILVLLCLCKEKRSFFDKPRLQRLPKRSSVPQKTGITIPRIRHKPNSCAFVSLQGKTLFIWQIKVAKTAKAKLCATKNRHRGSRGALAHKNSLLTKRCEPKPTNSACAEFANQNAGSINEKTFQSENRRTVQEFCFAEFLSFCTGLLIKQEFPDAKAPLSLIFDYF